ncbi:MAG: hypothetical protein Q8896_00385 [Bacteroidota bacterium]|nr:hypothetical protein [Bacteroidota bacterium]MDP4235988.1 hypothetical protein [Bacteroidota bacterium]
MGRALEIDEFTGLDQIREFGKIARKTVYNYSNDGSETEELHYHWRFSDPHNEIRKEQWREYPDSIALKELLSRPLEYLLYSRKHEKIDSAARSIESETYDYYDGDSSITDWTYSFFNLDRAWHPIREIHKHKSPISPDTFEWKIKYVRNRKGLLLRKTFSDGGTSDMWTYDKNGNCTSHLQPHSRYHDVWKYDSKGNLVEFNTGSYKNTFKISYK